MIKHIWSMVARESKVDAMSNNISIIDALESLQLTADTEDKSYKPGLSIGLPLNFEIVSLFFREKKGKPAEAEEIIIVLDPKGEKLGEFTSKIMFQAEHNRMRNMIKFNMIAVSVPGTYLFQVFLKNGKSEGREQVATIPIDITMTVNGSQIA